MGAIVGGMTLTIAAVKPMHEAHRVAEDGAVDADGHILEPPTLWEDYIDPAFRDRALRFQVDEDGLEELEIDGRRSEMSRRGFPATLGAMGAPDLADIQKNPERTYLRESPYGAMDPAERIEVLDAENIDIAHPVHDRRPAVGGRGGGPGAVAGVHEGVQPLDL